MRIKGLNNLALAMSFLAAASGAQAGALTASAQDGDASFAAPGLMTMSASALSLLHGKAGYIDGFSIMTAYQNVSGSGMVPGAGDAPWDFAPSWIGDFSNAPSFEIRLPAPVVSGNAPSFDAPPLTGPLVPAPLPPEAFAPVAPATVPAPGHPPAAPAEAAPLVPAAPAHAPLPTPAAAIPPPMSAGSAPVSPPAPGADGDAIHLPMPENLPAIEEEPPAAVPEPASAALFGFGLAGLLIARRRK